MPNPSSGSVNDLAPTVDPADLRSVWNMQHKVQAQLPGQCVAIADRSFEHVCSPGADIQAVWYRASMLLMLCQGPLAARHGDLDEKVFRVAAEFPMKQMQPGIPQQGPPFNVKEFLKQIEQSA